MGRIGEGRFAGFGPRALPFLQALAFHQDKGWFEENRPIYEADLRAPLEALVLDLSDACATAGLPLRGDRRSLFRLHRDVRFGKDKRPYKTNAGAVLSPDGTRKAQGLLYVHLDPEGCFAAAGFWQPEPAQLGAIRTATIGDPGRFHDLVTALRRAKLAFADGDPLTRPPRGFEAAEPGEVAEAVKRRNHVVRRPITPEALAGPGLVRDLAAFARDAEPLLRFGWAALGGPTQEER